MSAAAPADLAARVAALEAALALPSSPASGGSLEAAVLAERVQKLEETVRKQAYRIQHLVRAYEAKVKEVEELQKK